MSTTVLSTETRELKFTKGELNRFRKQGKVPAVLFGKGMESVPLFVDLVEFKKAYSANGKIFEINAAGSKHLINAKQIQTNAIGNIVMHIDFLKLNRNQETTVKVAVSLIGESPGATKEGGVIQVINDIIEVTGVPRDIPESIEIDISELALGENITVGDIKLGKGVKLGLEDDVTVVTCSAPKTQEEPETAEAAEGEEAAGDNAPAAETTDAPEAKAEDSKE